MSLISSKQAPVPTSHGGELGDAALLQDAMSTAAASKQLLQARREVVFGAAPLTLRE